jgi:hypothetical protein
MKTNKICFFIIIFFVFVVRVFSQEKGFIFTNNLRVRNRPAINAQVIGNCSDKVIVQVNGKNETIYNNKLIYVYDKKGSGRYINGVWDYWYKISEKENYWINGFYVAFFPIYFRYDISAAGYSYKIIDIDNNYHFTYYLIPPVSSTRSHYSKGEMTDVEMMEKITDSPILRLSELVKDINRRINGQGYHNIEHFDLLYDINNIKDEETIETILGKIHMGAPPEFGYNTYDINLVYEINFMRWPIRMGKYHIYGRFNAPDVKLVK